VTTILNAAEELLAQRWRIFFLEGQEEPFLWDAGSQRLVSVPVGVAKYALQRASRDGLSFDETLGQVAERGWVRDGEPAGLATDVRDIEQYYDQNVNLEWNRLERHRTEFAVTMRALQEHLPPPPAAILDVGGGPGRYAVALTQHGYQVTLVDLSQVNLESARRLAREAGSLTIECLQGNALDLAGLASERYDAVLLLGPLYLLLTRAEREQAVREAGRVLRPGGRIFAAFLNRYFLLTFWTRSEPSVLRAHRQGIKKFMETGVHPIDPTPDAISAYFAHPFEILPLMEGMGFMSQALISSGGFGGVVDERIEDLDGDAWDAWVDLNYRLGQDPPLHGAASRLLYVGIKR
jgi:ubiquinone/menaquinone biosynthesis C-methylase UbiE